MSFSILDFYTKRMSEPKKDTQNTKNGEERISIESLPEAKESNKSQAKKEEIIIPIHQFNVVSLAKHNVGLKKIATEDVNPLFYEIGPFPRRPQRVVVNVMGLHAVPAEDPLNYDPSRNDFVRLVFFIVLTMLICTCGICIFCNLMKPVKDIFIHYGMFICIGAGVTNLILSYAFACSGCTRVCPCNVICLFLTVIAFSAICAYLIIRLKTYMVLIALGSTSLIVLLCIILACTSFDFTKFALVVGVAMMAICMASMGYFLYVLITKEPVKPVQAALLILGTLVHSVTLIIEFQMVIGGKTIELSTDDYALGAFLIYTSIITIFLKILSVVNILEDD